MEKEKKLDLVEIKVHSFNTTLETLETLEREKQRRIKGGSQLVGGTTSPPIFC